MILPDSFWHELPGIITALASATAAMYGMLNHGNIKTVQQNTDGINSRLQGQVEKQTTEAAHLAEITDKDKTIAALTKKVNGAEKDTPS